MDKYGSDVVYERGSTAVVKCAKCKKYFQRYEKDQKLCPDCEGDEAVSSAFGQEQEARHA